MALDDLLITDDVRINFLSYASFRFDHGTDPETGAMSLTIRAYCPECGQLVEIVCTDEGALVYDHRPSCPSCLAFLRYWTPGRIAAMIGVLDFSTPPWTGVAHYPWGGDVTSLEGKVWFREEEITHQ